MPPAARAAAPAPTHPDSRSTPMAIAVGVVLLVGLGSCAPGGAAHLVALADACALAWPAALWIASACGLGRWLAMQCRWSALEPWPAAAATGACALAAADAAVGWAGLLSGGASALWSWALLMPGIAACVWSAAGGRRIAAGNGPLPDGHRAAAAVFRPWWLPICMAIAVPALVVAAASEPGVLWSTEFGAYDALSYHLTLPQEWHLGDGIATLRHCAYSGMPSWMEAAYLHIRALGGGRMIGGSSWFASAQMLHASLALVAALCTGAAARAAVNATGAHPSRSDEHPHGGDCIVADAVACVLVLGMPWLAVTGTLAYSESLMLCALAAALCVISRGVQDRSLGRRDLLALALLAVAAFGAKPSAALLVVLPVVAAALALWRSRTAAARVADAVACAALAVALLAPWWVRNWLATGNPTFPFAESLWGAGWWTPEQSARFTAAHAAPQGLSPWVALWQQWIAFGWGAPPATGVAWRPLWSLMPVMAVAAATWATIGALRTRTVRTSCALCALILAVQVAAWLAGTHLQSRFLLPTVVPGAVLVACNLVQLPKVRHSAILAVALIAWSAQPALAFLSDGREPRLAALWIGAAHDLAGTGAARPSGTDMRDSTMAPSTGTPPSNLVQAINALDPGSARVASVGLAATAWVRADIPLDWCSVWDRGAVARALAATGGDGRAAAQVLADEGWTHLAIDEVMIDVWSRSGWIDPILGPGAIEGLRAGGRVVWSGPHGALLALDGDGP